MKKVEYPPFDTGWIIVYGELGSKSNSRKVVRFGNRTAVIKSDTARQYCKDFLKQVGANRKPYEGPVKLTAICYYKDMRRDLDIALLQDLLQEGTPKNPGACFIKNDRQIRHIEAIRKVDKDEPRVEFKLSKTALD